MTTAERVPHLALITQRNLAKSVLQATFEGSNTLTTKARLFCTHIAITNQDGN
jgi:hypothetical protein